MKFIRIEKRDVPSSSMRNFYPILSVLMALSVGAVFILMAGANPLDAYENLFYGAFGNTLYITETMVKTAPLLLAGLGATIAFKSNVWNIGLEGQLYAGALVVTWLGLTFTEMPATLLLPLVILGGFMGGVLCGAIPGVLKAKFGINEIITTLMMNSILIYFVAYLVENPWLDRVTGYPQSPLITSSARLPILIPGTRFHAGILLAFLCVLLLYILLQKSILGYKIRAIGVNPNAARCGGIPTARYFLIAMIISSGLAGLAGMGQVSGIGYRMRGDISPGYGYTAIVVALVGRLHPVGVALTALFFGALSNGSEMMHRVTGIPVALVEVTQALVLLFLIGSEILIYYKIRRG